MGQKMKTLFFTRVRSSSIQFLWLDETVTIVQIFQKPARKGLFWCLEAIIPEEPQLKRKISEFPTQEVSFTLSKPVLLGYWEKMVL